MTTRLALIASRAPLVRAKIARFRRHYDELVRRMLSGEVEPTGTARVEALDTVNEDGTTQAHNPVRQSAYARRRGQ